MPYFAVASTRDFDAAVRRAGNAALGLWTRAGAWSVARLTDGHIPQEVAEDLGTAPQIRRLVSSGLWAETVDGYAFTTWESDGNRTRNEVENLSEVRRNAGRSGGKASGKSRRSEREADERTPDSPPDTPPDQQKPEAHASSKTNPLPYPSLPSPTHPPTGDSARARVTLPPDIAAVVEAWADGAGTEPSRTELRKIIGEARELLALSGMHPDDVLAGARMAGRDGWPTIRVSVRKMQARSRPTVDDRTAEWQALKTAAREADRRTGPPGRFIDGDVVEPQPLRAVGGR